MNPLVATPDGCAVITGASSGIGAALASALAARGHRLVLVARRGALLEALAAELRALHDVEVELRVVDLADRYQRVVLAKELATRPVDILCNNAGVASFGPLRRLDFGDERAQVELNAVAVHDLTLAVLPGMLARGSGGILISGSAAGNLPIPNNATYAATKAFANAFSESLHSEVKGAGVHVTLLAPGPVRTEESPPADASIVDRFVPGFMWVSSRQAAAEALDALAHNKMRVVPGLVGKALSVVGRFAPRGLTGPVLGKLYGRLGESDPQD